MVRKYVPENTLLTRTGLSSKPMTKLGHVFFLRVCVSAPCSRCSTSLFKLHCLWCPALIKNTLFFFPTEHQLPQSKQSFDKWWEACHLHWGQIKLVNDLNGTPCCLPVWQPATLTVWVNMTRVEVFSTFQGDFKSTLEAWIFPPRALVEVVQQNIREVKVLWVGPNSFVSSHLVCPSVPRVVLALWFIGCTFFKPSHSESSKPAQGFRKLF